MLELPTNASAGARCSKVLYLKQIVPKVSTYRFEPC
jgi:hypothetical protein